MYKITAFDGVNQHIKIGDEVAHATYPEMNIGVIEQIRTAANASGQAILTSWKEVRFIGSKRWIKANKVVKINRFRG